MNWLLRKYAKVLLRFGKFWKLSEVMDKITDKTAEEQEMADIIRSHWTKEELDIIGGK